MLTYIFVPFCLPCFVFSVCVESKRQTGISRFSSSSKKMSFKITLTCFITQMAKNAAMEHNLAVCYVVNCIVYSLDKNCTFLKQSKVIVYIKFLF